MTDRRRYKCPKCRSGGAHPASWPAPFCHKCEGAVVMEVELPEPTIIKDMDWCENEVYDIGDLQQYGDARDHQGYLRGLEHAKQVCLSLFDPDDDSCNEAETCAAAIEKLKGE